MFELAPVSLWLEDFSGVAALFAQWRAQGVSDLRAWLRADRARVAACTRPSGCCGSTAARWTCSARPARTSC
jgi:hypothetical protein